MVQFWAFRSPSLPLHLPMPAALEPAILLAPLRYCRWNDDGLYLLYMCSHSAFKLLLESHWPALTIDSKSEFYFCFPSDEPIVHWHLLRTYTQAIILMPCRSP